MTYLERLEELGIVKRQPKPQPDMTVMVLDLVRAAATVLLMPLVEPDPAEERRDDARHRRTVRSAVERLRSIP